MSIFDAAWREHCEYEEGAYYDYHSELWAAEAESMREEGIKAQQDYEEENDI